MFAFAIATLGLTQWALVKTRANIVIPSFTSTSIILTTLLGIFVIDESIFNLQIGGIVLIILGIILMNITSKKPKEDPETSIEFKAQNIDADIPQDTQSQ